ncbi:MAG: hypothetical protein Q8J64_06740 [Thermodesulfovibrionales bacterium]|nr:hypothetical protein [Thermodesulfovibrionales bacterium]
MKKITLVVLALAAAGYLAYTTVDGGAPSAIAKKAKYTGTLYVAGMGGHFTTAEVEINPSDSQPIVIKNLDRIVIGNKDTHPTHDARIDVNDRTKMYWSTYKVDKSKEGGKTVHVGVSDLKTGEVIKDVALNIDDRVKWSGALYCGSGQSKSMFIPVMMTGEAYIDVFDKKTLELKHRVFLDEIGYKAGTYMFFHGTNSPDMKTFAVAINMTTPWEDPSKPGKPIGKIDMLLLDLPALEQGKVKVIAKNTLTGDPDKTKTFREYFSPDGKYLLQSGGDRLYLLDGKTLKLLDEEMMTDGEAHDAMATPDSNYAILPLRTKIKSTEGKDITDGTVQLYDIKERKIIGKTSSVCYDCHKNVGLHGNSILCGLDGNLN